MSCPATPLPFPPLETLEPEVARESLLRMRTNMFNLAGNHTDHNLLNKVRD